MNDLGIYLRDGPFESDIVIVYLHPTKGTHWVKYINGKTFDVYGCVCPKKLSRFIIKRNRHSLNSEYKVQGLTSERDSCASYYLYKIYLTNVLGRDYKSGVLKLYYQMIQCY